MQSDFNRKSFNLSNNFPSLYLRLDISPKKLRQSCRFVLIVEIFGRFNQFFGTTKHNNFMFVKFSCQFSLKWCIT